MLRIVPQCCSCYPHFMEMKTEAEGHEFTFPKFTVNKWQYQAAKSPLSIILLQ